MATKLFVGGLSWDTTEDSLRSFFAATGTVVSATVITDKYTGKSKGFGFVEMASDEEAQRAMHEADGKELDGRNIAVKEAQERQDRPDRGGSGGSRNYGGGGGNNYRNGR